MHQIRSQFSAAGAPLVGDAMYGVLSGLSVGGGGFSVAGGGGAEGGGDGSESSGGAAPTATPELEAAIGRCRQQEAHIGLHAWRLHWRGLQLEAPVPWRRC
jgi:23S rRNA-/tRNA-specific pseudouridylate synthase